MTRILSWLAVIVVVVGGAEARGDGLLYQLPEDGGWARFEIEITNKNNAVRKVGLIMRSVGRVAESEGSRWLEFQIPQEDGTKTVKVLIPEKRLKEGEAPLEHVLRAWAKRGDNAPESVMRVRDYWLLLVLAGPLNDVKKLDEKTLESPLGALECKGLSGSAQLRDDYGNDIDLTYAIRRHEKAPFGVVACAIDSVVRKDGAVKSQTKIELKLVEAGKGAKADLQNYE